MTPDPTTYVDPRERGCTCTWDEIEGAEGIVVYDWFHCPVHTVPDAVDTVDEEASDDG